jgi:DNA repair exonuclease SbcCD ATPase subunit
MKKVIDLNKSYNAKLQDSAETLRNVSWTLGELTWDYLFNYGEGNKVDFSKLEGIVGIFGKNYSGKSAIVDTLLYALFNSTSKSIRKNLNIINQNQEYCTAKATFFINGNEYTAERRSEKYKKRLHGVQTDEAKTDLDFYEVSVDGVQTGLNGTSRQDTDKNIRKYTGSLEDFLMTSMASQLDSLSFINEGSTKRKEILAKFLDLEIFDKKFRMAKEDSASTSAALKRLEGNDYESQIESIKSEILKAELKIESNKAECEGIKNAIIELSNSFRDVESKIRSVPADIIDPVVTGNKIEHKKSLILRTTQEKTTATRELADSEEKFEKIDSFLKQFDIDSYQEKKELIENNKSRLEKLLGEMKESSEAKTEGIRKQSLLAEVPCGSKYPSCKFIKDAHSAGALIQISESRMATAAKEINKLGESIGALQPEVVDSHIDKYNKLVDKRNKLATSVASCRLTIERSDSLLFREQVELEKLQAKRAEYQENKEAIENLKELLSFRNEIENKISEKQTQLNDCEDNTILQHKKHGSLEQKLETTFELSKEYEKLKEEFAAYHLLMTCYHPNGISYDIIKERLPIINQEIAKILTNIVDFEIFIKNDDKKLDIFIKHPSHGPRPLEMGSGAEKSIASMAIRLAFLTVSSLPKSDLFILDEPGTALDEENMEGFIRILDMVKGYFKTVVLISHLESLKDCVDMQINIDRVDGYAHVNI